MEFVNVWILPLVVGTIGFATPLVLAALGGLFSERAGVVNIALEGLMIVGAFFAVWGSHLGGSWFIGLIFAVAAGAGFSLLHAVASINFHADQIISGTALILFATGFVDYLNLTIFGAEGAPKISRVPRIDIGSVQVGLTTFIAVGLVFLTHFIVFRTPFGLHLRSVGEHPRAADTVGINVVKMRYIAVMLSGALAGLAGAYLSIDFGDTYSQGMTGGMGFIALAALIFGKWNPKGTLLAAMLFGFTKALAGVLQSQFGITPELVEMIPYVITIIALAGFVGKSTAPAAIGKPYTKA